MQEFGKVLLMAGVMLCVTGILLTQGSRLPGDFMYRKGSFALYFPLATCIIISLVLSLIFNVFLRRR